MIFFLKLCKYAKKLQSLFKDNAKAFVEPENIGILF